MRAHEVPNYPDPNSKGQTLITPNSGINPTSPACQTASTDCKSLSPAGNFSQTQQQQAMAGALKFADRVRKNCVPATQTRRSVPTAAASCSAHPASTRTRRRSRGRRRSADHC